MRSQHGTEVLLFGGALANIQTNSILSSATTIYSISQNQSKYSEQFCQNFDECTRRSILANICNERSNKPWHKDKTYKQKWNLCAKNEFRFHYILSANKTNWNSEIITTVSRFALNDARKIMDIYAAIIVCHQRKIQLWKNVCNNERKRIF